MLSAWAPQYFHRIDTHTCFGTLLESSTKGGGGWIISLKFHSKKHKQNHSLFNSTRNEQETNFPLQMRIEKENQILMKGNIAGDGWIVSVVPLEICHLNVLWRWVIMDYDTIFGA